MQSAISITYQWLPGILGLLMNASAGMPFIALLALFAGRRKNAVFLWAEKILSLNLALSLTGILYFIYSYLIQILPYKNDLDTQWTPFFKSAGLPYSSSLCIWTFGIFFIYLAKYFMPSFNNASIFHNFTYLKKTVFFCIISIVCFFATFCLINWPFAGLPEGLSIDRAFFAIFRNACRQYFTTFGNASAFILFFAVFFPVYNDAIQHFVIKGLSAIAVLCHLPYILKNWSIFLGLYYSSKGSLITGSYLPQFFGVSFLTFAIFCWAGIFLKPVLFKFLSITGLGLLVIAANIQFIFQFYRL